MTIESGDYCTIWNASGGQFAVKLFRSQIGQESVLVQSSDGEPVGVRAYPVSQQDDYASIIQASDGVDVGILAGRRLDFALMAFIDESSPYQFPAGAIAYSVDLAELQNIYDSLDDTSRVNLGVVDITHSTASSDNSIITDPDPVLVLDSAAPRFPALDDYIGYWESLRNGRRPDILYAFADSSGSMSGFSNSNGLNEGGGWDSFKAYLAEEFETTQVIELTYGTERWLLELSNQLEDIRDEINA
jgi:hypothetical protein